MTQGIIESINSILKTHTQIRISVLKSANRDKNKVKEMADEIAAKANYPSSYKIIGFTIILRKQSKYIKSK